MMEFSLYYSNYARYLAIRYYYIFGGRLYRDPVNHKIVSKGSKRANGNESNGADYIILKRAANVCFGDGKGFDEIRAHEEKGLTT